jgi:DNA polymerase III epsilon subunit-like protein
MSKLVFIDIETGGLDSARHPIIQIAAIAFDTETAVECPGGNFECKVKFREELCDPEALALRYKPEDWTGALAPAVANDRLSKFLREHATVERVSKAGHPYLVAQLAGHNAAGFDVPFLRRWYERLNTEDQQRKCPRPPRFFPASFHVLDTMHLALWKYGGRTSAAGAQYPKSYKLADLCAHVGVELPEAQAHDALADVLATARLAWKLYTGMAVAA